MKTYKEVLVTSSNRVMAAQGKAIIDTLLGPYGPYPIREIQIDGRKWRFIGPKYTVAMLLLHKDAHCFSGYGCIFGPTSSALKFLKEAVKLCRHYNNTREIEPKELFRRAATRQVLSKSHIGLISFTDIETQQDQINDYIRQKHPHLFDDDA